MKTKPAFLIGFSFCVALGGSAHQAPLEAQEAHAATGYQRPPVEEAFRIWKAGDRLGQRVLWSIITGGQHSAATVDSALSGLERLALTAKDPLLRHHATTTLFAAGSSTVTSHPLPGLVDRARSLYDATSDRVVRILVVRSMSRQAERAEAIAFLKEVIAEGDPLSDGFDQSTTHFAIDTLDVIGEEGREALRELYERGAITRPAVGYLRYLKVIPRQ